MRRRNLVSPKWRAFAAESAIIRRGRRSAARVTTPAASTSPCPTAPTPSSASRPYHPLSPIAEPPRPKDSTATAPRGTVVASMRDLPNGSSTASRLIVSPKIRGPKFAVDTGKTTHTQQSASGRTRRRGT